MRPMKVLVLGHSLPDFDGDGGQQRVAALYRALAELECEVSRSVILWPESVEFVRNNLPGAEDEIIAANHNESDYIWWLHEYFLGLQTSDDASCSASLGRRLRGVQVLVIDHLWAWPLAVRAIAETGWEGRIVYHAHNAEHQARLDLYVKGLVSGRVAQATIESIEFLEKGLCRRADLVIACTEVDRQDLTDKGGRLVTVVPNGGRPRPMSAPGERSGFLYVASNWHPNLVGFELLVLRALEGLSTPVSITIAGGAGKSLEEPIRRSREKWVSKHKINVLGRISSEQLTKEYCRHSAVLIPLELGTGSCIKTAEALASGMPAICTPHGARGYEEFLADLSSDSWATAGTPDEWGRDLVRMDGASHAYEPRTELGWREISSMLASGLSVVTSEA